MGAAEVIESATAVPSAIGCGALAVSNDGTAAAVWLEVNAEPVPWANVYR